MLIDFVPTVSGVSLAMVPAFKKAPGGAPANVAVGIAKMGGHAAFIGKVGDDEFGHMLAGVLKENGVDDKGILFDSHARTALTFVALRSDGEREFTFYRNPSADMLLTEAELDKDLIQQARIFHYGSISLLTEPCRSAHFAAMKMAKDAGAILSYDPNLRLPLWASPEEARNGILSIWDKADVIKVSEDEVAFLTNGGDYEKAEVIETLMHPGLKLLLITEGGKGCRYHTKNFRGKIKGLAVNPVDTTGAGDAYVGAFLNELVKYMSLLEVIPVFIF
uniref:fructokinase n=1 Tax=Cryptomeria japonica TaxID=3369 RepID=A0A1V1FN75_CRYJA|nr:fructokinase [Cryptomeria japonica]